MSRIACTFLTLASPATCLTAFLRICCLSKAYMSDIHTCLHPCLCIIHTCIPVSASYMHPCLCIIPAVNTAHDWDAIPTVAFLAPRHVPRSTRAGACTHKMHMPNTRQDAHAHAQHARDSKSPSTHGGMPVSSSSSRAAEQAPPGSKASQPLPLLLYHSQNTHPSLPPATSSPHTPHKTSRHSSIH